MKLVKASIAFLLFLSLSTCAKVQGEKTEEKPNILWIFLEDTAPLLSSYGEKLISTPNIDSLAQQGVLYTNVYMPAPVCSASRSSIITGVMATTFGAQNHHSSRTKESAINLQEGLKTIPEVFKKEGYFTFNNGKDDYNFVYDRLDLYSQDYKVHPLYGKSGIHLEFSTLKVNQPFFGQIQMYGGKEIFSSTFKDRVKTPVDRSKIVLPPYLPNHPVIIEEYANHLDAILSINNYHAGYAAVAKYPALTVPMGYKKSGEPISLTFVAKQFQEAELLQLGLAFEKATKVRKMPQNYH